ncbi:UNKNOWN [Stylonychia lemnae]|uniref:Uncharacterized protein n=1 Tax=Stylonychia lemnae TaxID=5949 RepID=A0A077ZM41_STYLE|nr:UNKNOWN [Stylonychia lemnae]|eukprot:CDW71072.1 UNKNOWN [Stylonychia lemnae]
MKNQEQKQNQFNYQFDAEWDQDKGSMLENKSESQYKISDKQQKMMLKFERIKNVIDRDYMQQVQTVQRQTDPILINEKIKAKAENDNTLTQEKVRSTLKQCMIKNENSNELIKPLKTQEIIKEVIQKLNVQKSQSRQFRTEKNITTLQSKSKKFVNNEYLNMDDETFIQKLNQNRMYLRLKMIQVQEAQKIHNHLLHKQ